MKTEWKTSPDTDVELDEDGGMAIYISCCGDSTYIDPEFMEQIVQAYEATKYKPMGGKTQDG